MPAVIPVTSMVVVPSIAPVVAAAILPVMSYICMLSPRDVPVTVIRSTAGLGATDNEIPVPILPPPIPSRDPFTAIAAGDVTA